MKGILSNVMVFQPYGTIASGIPSQRDARGPLDTALSMNAFLAGKLVSGNEKGFDSACIAILRTPRNLRVLTVPSVYWK